MIVAGLGSMIQLYPLWKIGSGLPIVMGISFTFVSIFCFVGPTYGYGAIVGAVIVGGIIEGILGLFAKSYWKQLSVLFGLVMGYLVAIFMGKVDFSALAASGLSREATTKELSGSISADGFISAVSGLFGCLPITSFSQNVGLISMTKVVNRFTIFTGCAIMVLAGLFPMFGALLATLPDAVLADAHL